MSGKTSKKSWVKARSNWLEVSNVMEWHHRLEYDLSELVERGQWVEQEHRRRDFTSPAWSCRAGLMSTAKIIVGIPSLSFPQRRPSWMPAGSHDRFTDWKLDTHLPTSVRGAELPTSVRGAELKVVVSWMSERPSLLCPLCYVLHAAFFHVTCVPWSSPYQYSQTCAHLSLSRYFVSPGSPTEVSGHLCRIWELALALCRPIIWKLVAGFCGPKLNKSQ